jgi:hypothetical protein
MSTAALKRRTLRTWKYPAPNLRSVVIAALAAGGLAQLFGLLISNRNHGLLSFIPTDLRWTNLDLSQAPSVRQRRSTIFFNIFIPDDGSFSIVSEQLNQIAESYAGGYYQQGGNNSVSDAPLPTVHVYYLTLGADMLPESRMNNSSDLCGAYPHFQCHHLGHHTNGFEAITLEHMHGYCRTHPSERVVYLHNKGSFHPVPGLTDGWRQALTLGAIAKDCMEPPDDRCNVCGFMWYTVFATFVPGNMFTAKCEYVSKLLPPLVEFPISHRAAVGEGLLLRARRQLMSNVIPEDLERYGFGRHNAEHWIGTLW